MTPHELQAAGVQLEQTASVETLVGWLVTHPDGYEARLGPDRTRAEVYLRTHRGRAIEAMYVRRPVGVRHD